MQKPDERRPYLVLTRFMGIGALTLHGNGQIVEMNGVEFYNAAFSRGMRIAAASGLPFWFDDEGKWGQLYSPEGLQWHQPLMPYRNESDSSIPGETL